MRRTLLALAGLIFATSLTAQTADEIIAKYVKAIGGADRIAAIQTIRRSGKFIGGGGFQAVVVQENKRPDQVRQEFTFQGMTGVTAWDGRGGWKIQPWEGKKDAEPLGEDETKVIIEEADIDGPLVDYAKKGNKVEYEGMEPVEGTDAYKLKVTLPSGDVKHFYIDTDYFVPIQVDSTRIVRGAPRESETVLGDYKEVSGVYFPFSIEMGQKGDTFRQKLAFDRIETNVPVAGSRFARPGQAGAAPAAPDASQLQPKQKDEKKPAADEKKPPVK